MLTPPADFDLAKMAGNSNHQMIPGMIPDKSSSSIKNKRFHSEAFPQNYSNFESGELEEGEEP